MYFVYILESRINSKKYIGFTTKNPNLRLKEHNAGKGNWTKKYKPFNLIHSESFKNRKDAINRERFLKTWRGRGVLAKLDL